jgi:hypothetical protein
MRRTVLVLVLLLAGTVHAGPRFGVHAGITSSRLTRSDHGDPSDPRHGLVAGAHATIRLGSRTALRPEICYTQRGGVFKDLPSWGSSLVTVREARFEVDYLEVPLLLRWLVLPYDLFNMVVSVGPVWRTALRSEASIDGHPVEDWSADSGLAVAAGYAITKRFDGFGLAFDGRYILPTSSVGPDVDGVDVGHAWGIDLRLAVTF